MSDTCLIEPDSDLSDSDRRSVPVGHLTSKGLSTASDPKAYKLSNSRIWDPWPDGTLVFEGTRNDWTVSKHFSVHWATTPYSNKPKKGADQGPNASTWKNGVRRSKRCIGVIECSNEFCGYTERPLTTKADLKAQTEKLCPQCQCRLVHVDCEVTIHSYEWAGGFRWEHKGFHDHGRPRPIHLTKEEEAELERRVAENPTVSPLAMIMGGPGCKSIADLSETLLNTHRLRWETSKSRQKLGLKWSGNLVTDMSRFEELYPRTLVSEYLEELGVLCIQTDFMRQRAVDSIRLEETVASSFNPVYGFVTDAAHKFFKEKNSLLVLSSRYIHEMYCWMPVLATYSSGQSAEHYMVHFLVLMMTMQDQANEWKMGELKDEWLIQVMDFSAAQSKGFTDAFVAFRLQALPETQANDPKVIADLMERAELLKRGCEQHYRASVTRLARTLAIVPAEESHTFKNLANGLVTASPQQFRQDVQTLKRKFPLAGPWIDWWQASTVAKKLFKAKSEMHPIIRLIIPDTTNAGESQHNKIYIAAGKYLPVFQGLVNLVFYFGYYERRFSAMISTPLHL
jgi:hypothetical protein